MKKFLLPFAISFISIQSFANDLDTPQFLYKILSAEDWDESQGSRAIELSLDDEDFIHFSKEDQLDRILDKYWADEAAIVLKIDVSKLSGDLVYETNPGGSSKYYHLYDGEIPLDAVVDATAWK